MYQILTGIFLAGSGGATKIHGRIQLSCPGSVLTMDVCYSKREGQFSIEYGSLSTGVGGGGYQQFVLHVTYSVYLCT